MHTLLQDLRYAIRQLLKNPGFGAVAILTLALGIGAATALFSVVYGVLISPYPYAKPEGIWTPGLRSPSADPKMRPYRLTEYLEMARLPVFSDVMATAPGSALLSGEFGPENLRGIRVSGNAFEFLGVHPLIGRTIRPADIRASGEPESVTVLSFKRWQRLFGGDPNVVGKRALLVVAEVGLSVVLLVSAGLTIRSFIALQQVELGFRPEGAMVANLSLPPKRYATWEQRNRFAQELLERVKSLPGVQAATIGNGGLPFGGPQSIFGIDGHADSEARPIAVHMEALRYE